MISESGLKHVDRNTDDSFLRSYKTFHKNATVSRVMLFRSSSKINTEHFMDGLSHNYKIFSPNYKIKGQFFLFSECNALPH